MIDIEYAKKCFAAIVASDYGDIHEDMSWMLACGIGDDEDRWDNFEKWFKEVFGISWKEAENFRG